MQTIKVGLCGPGRHDIPQVGDNFVFPAIVDSPMDFSSHYQTSMKFIDNLPDDTHLYLYVTGLTPVLTSFLSAWVQRNDQRRRAGSSTLPITFYHFHRDTDDYEPCLF